MPDPALPTLCPTRRTVLRAGVSLGLAGLLAPAASACTPDSRTERISVAGGEQGGFYLEFAQLLSEALGRRGVARTTAALETGGSLDNLDRIASGEATLGIALADAAADRLAVQGPGDLANPSRIVALGKVYENYVHCLVRQDSRIRAVEDLAGAVVAIGDPRSGTNLTARRLLEASGLATADDADGSAAASALRTVPLGLNQGLAALRAREVDALFWSGGVPTAAIAAANAYVGLTLLDLSPLIPATRARHGSYYDRVLVPADGYAGLPATWTVGVANLLLCRADLDAGVAGRVVELLLGHADELVPASSQGLQFLSPETLISTAGIPLHPGAEAAYRAFHG